MQIRRKMGAYLKKLRQERNLLMDEVVVELQSLRINCSQSNLSRIELDQSSVRADILAGLCIIYKISSERILFRQGSD
jgi:transcriptional regulator with XRE-family HTH domain